MRMLACWGVWLNAVQSLRPTGRLVEGVQYSWGEASREQRPADRSNPDRVYKRHILVESSSSTYRGVDTFRGIRIASVNRLGFVVVRPPVITPHGSPILALPTNMDVLLPSPYASRSEGAPLGTSTVLTSSMGSGSENGDLTHSSEKLATKTWKLLLDFTKPSNV